MRFETASRLPKLGDRPYIQGGSIFNEMLEVFDDELGPGWTEGAVVSSFKLEREGQANGRIIVADEPVEDVDPNAVLIGRRPAGKLYGYYLDEGREVERVPYEEASYYQVVDVGPDLRGEFVFAGGRERADFMRGIVGANKLLHQKTDRFGCELTRIQFLYLKGLDLICLSQGDEDARVKIGNMTVQERENEAWTINRVGVETPSFHSEFRICYRAQKVR